MKTQHTPGPWNIAEYGIDNPAYTIRRGSKQIARIMGPRLFGDCLGVIPEQSESQANARLIASAPELLAALRGLLENAENLVKFVNALKDCEKVDQNGNATAAFDYSPEMDLARAAIAKAEGNA